MFDFEVKDLEQLMISKIKNDIDDFQLQSRYLYIYEHKMIFLVKSKDTYKILCSGACHFEPVRRTNAWDILYFTKDFEEAKCMYNSYVMRLFWDNKHELHTTTGETSKD